MYECFHCRTRSVIHSADFNPEDIGVEGPGVVHILHCTNCGANITYVVYDEKEETNREEDKMLVRREDSNC